MYNGQVDWKLGALLASGQMLGGWMAASFAMDHPKANIWVRRLLVLMIIASAFELFGLRVILFNMLRG